MANKRLLRGTVVAEHTNERRPGATVRLEAKDPAKGVEPAFCNADDDGDFSFDITDEQRWPAGEYVLVAFHPDSALGPAESTVQLKAGKAPEFQWVKLPDRALSNRVGLIFFIVLIVLLGGLVYGYFALHQAYPNQPTPIDDDLSQVVRLAQRQVGDAASVHDSSAVLATIDAADSVFTTLVRLPDQALFSTQKEQIVRTLLGEARSAITAGNAAGLRTVLEGLDEIIQHPAPRFFWESYPWRLLEILLWALTATMLRLAIDAGRYLLNRTFYKHSVPHHVAVVATVPFLAVLIAFVLSLVEVSIALSDVELSLDMSNIAISIVVAALIGIAPWRAWDFISRLADNFFDTLAGLTGGGD